MTEPNRIEHLNHLVDRLCDRLRIGSETFRSERREREAAVYQLCALIEFLHEFEEPKKEGLTYPLLNLVNALSHLDEGIPSVLFKFTRRRGQQAEDTHRAFIRIYAAATMELLMRSGLSLQEATKQVAQILDKEGLKRLQRKDAIEPTTVTYWREKLRRGNGEDSDDFWEIVRTYRPLIDDPPDGLRPMLIASLRDVVRTSIQDA